MKERLITSVLVRKFRPTRRLNWPMLRTIAVAGAAILVLLSIGLIK